MDELNLNALSDMEDISSSSKKFKEKKNPVKAYGNGIFKNLGGIIKAIAFVIAFGIMAVCFLAAFFLFAKDTVSTIISLGILLFGTILAAILLFLIYGLGHLICQNDEILRRLNK